MSGIYHCCIELGRGGGDEFGWGADEGLRVGARSRHSEGKLRNGADGRQSENDGWIVGNRVAASKGSG